MNRFSGLLTRREYLQIMAGALLSAAAGSITVHSLLAPDMKLPDLRGDETLKWKALQAANVSEEVRQEVMKWPAPPKDSSYAAFLGAEHPHSN